MPHISSGSILREARERKNYELTTVARRLRIRPDILRAIECSDFSAMPPRGYTRNMVNAYARFLGLNPTEIVNMYLDEQYAYQVEKARDSAPARGFVIEGSYQRRPRLGIRTNQEIAGFTRNNASSAELYRENYTSNLASGRTQFRHLYDDRTQYSHDGYGTKRSSIKRPDRTDRDFLSHHSGYSSEMLRGSDNRGFGINRSQGRGRSIRVGETPMQYSASRIPRILQSRTTIIAGIVLIVLVIITLIVFTVFGNKRPDSNDVSQLPVSGISDTTGTDEQQQAKDAQVDIAPTSARVMYSVDSGEECYVEIYENGELTTSNTLLGPIQETIEVIGTWTLTTWTPETISLTVDGSDVALTSNEEYGGMYAYTVDFPAILAEWNSTHPSKNSQRSAAVATANNAVQQAAEQAATEEEAAAAENASLEEENTYSEYTE